MNKAQDAKFARLDDPQVSPPILNELTGALSITRVGLTMPCSVHASINSVNLSIQSGDLKAPRLVVNLTRLVVVIAPMQCGFVPLLAGITIEALVPTLDRPSFLLQ